MNHIYLPGRADMKKANGTPARYAINAMELLINAIMSRGGDRHRLKAKAFGGGNLISAITPENSVGIRIAEFVVNFLKIEEIPLLHYDLGGKQGRQIHFYTDTGNVFLKPISPKLTPFLADRDLKEIKSITMKVELLEILLFFEILPDPAHASQ